MKESLKCHASQKWKEILQRILFGIRVSLKEDLQVWSSEIIYGTTLRVPRELVMNNSKYTHNQAKFEQNLRQIMEGIKPVAT